MTLFQKFAGVIRLPFLLLAVAQVLLATSVVYYHDLAVDPLLFTLVLIGAVSAHISVNTFNEYFDFRSGLDRLTQRTPFSGGSGTLVANPDYAPVAMLIGLATLLLTVVIGIYLLFAVGLALLPIGLLGIFLIVAYTHWVTRHPWISLFAPGLAFGPLMVMGSEYVLSGGFSGTALSVSLVSFFWANNLLLLNQFPDVVADKYVGRHNIVIHTGKEMSAGLFSGFVLFSYMPLMGGVVLGYLPPLILVTLATLPFAIPMLVRVTQHAHSTPMILPAMRANVMLNLVTPLLMALLLVIAAEY